MELRHDRPSARIDDGGRVRAVRHQLASARRTHRQLPRSAANQRQRAAFTLPVTGGGHGRCHHRAIGAADYAKRRHLHDTGRQRHHREPRNCAGDGRGASKAAAGRRRAAGARRKLVRHMRRHVLPRQKGGGAFGMGGRHRRSGISRRTGIRGGLLPAGTARAAGKSAVPPVRGQAAVHPARSKSAGAQDGRGRIPLRRHLHLPPCRIAGHAAAGAENRRRVHPR